MRLAQKYLVKGARVKPKWARRRRFSERDRMLEEVAELLDSQADEVVESIESHARYEEWSQQLEELEKLDDLPIP